MGIPRLKIKNELGYRKAGKNETRNCRRCFYFVPDFIVRSCGSGGEPIRTEGRCRIIGLKHSLRYRVLPHYTCIKQTTHEEYARFKIEAIRLFELGE